MKHFFLSCSSGSSAHNCVNWYDVYIYMMYVERNTLVKRSNFTYEVDDNNFQELRNVDNPK